MSEENHYEDQVSESKAWRAALPEDLRTMTPRTNNFAFNEDRRDHESGSLIAPSHSDFLEFSQQLELELNQAQSRLEKALADQRRNLCAESDTLIDQLKQAREWVNLSVAEVCSLNQSCAEYVAQMEKQIADGAKMLGMSTDLNLDLQNKVDMWRDEFQRIKAIEFNRPGVIESEIAGICDRAMLDIRSKISLIDQREKVAEENIDLRRELRVISDHYDILRAELVETNAKTMHGMFQAAANGKSMEYCRTITNAKLRGKCIICYGKGTTIGGEQGAQYEECCFRCEGAGYIEIPDLSWLKNGKIQFHLLTKEHPDYDPTLE